MHAIITDKLKFEIMYFVHRFDTKKLVVLHGHVAKLNAIMKMINGNIRKLKVMSQNIPGKYRKKVALY